MELHLDKIPVNDAGFTHPGGLSAGSFPYSVNSY